MKHNSNISRIFLACLSAVLALTACQKEFLVTKIDFSGSNTPDKDYQKLYEEELQKRMDFE